MTAQSAQGVSRPFAAALALVAMATFWIPTLSAPAAGEHGSLVVLAVSGAYAPVLM